MVRSSGFFTPDLLRTCRKVQKDAMSLFYAKNSFQADLTNGDATTLLAWLGTVDGPYLTLVPQLIISLNPHSFFDIEQLRHAESAGTTKGNAKKLAAALAAGGVSSDKILVEHPDMRCVVKDSVMLGCGNDLKDAEDLREKWFDALQEALDEEEYEMEEGESAVCDLGEAEKVEFEVLTGQA